MNNIAKKCLIVPLSNQRRYTEISISIFQLEVSTRDHEHSSTFYTGIPFIGEISWVLLILTPLRGMEEKTRSLLFIIKMMFKVDSTDFSFSELVHWVMGLQWSFGPLHFAQMAVIHNWDELKYTYWREDNTKSKYQPSFPSSINSQKIVCTKSQPRDYCYLMKPALFLRRLNRVKWTLLTKDYFPTLYLNDCKITSLVQ